MDAKVFSIADWLLIAVTFLGPIAAVQAQKWIERSREKRVKRLGIFQTLMATRALRAASNDHVQALNLIDVFFDNKSGPDKNVRTAWAVYFDFLAQKPPENMTPVEATAYNEKGVDHLVDMLEAMGKALGYDFNKVQLKRGAYYPQGHADDSAAVRLIRDNLARILTGAQPLNMNVVSFPVSENAMQDQKKVQDALLKVLSSEATVKIKSDK